MNYGPTVPFCDELHAQKYRSTGESFEDAMTRVASALKDSDEHFHEFRDILLNMRFMPAGRIQTSMGSTKNTTPYNCFVSPAIADTFVDDKFSIMDCAKYAAATMRMGGGIGYDFSTLRPRGAHIKKLESLSSGPVSFMDIFDAVCRCTASSGHRRGAQMGVIRVDHPDIEEFIHAKTNTTRLTGFNVSVAITDEFMSAVYSGKSFPLRFGGEIYRFVDAQELWEMIMRATWDWAEPGVLFIDQINRMNNLYYCETIAATNPCQPGFATVLQPAGITTFDKIDVGSVIWTGKQWTTITQKTATGVKSVFKFTTTAGSFIGTENHRVVSGGVKIEAVQAETLTLATGGVYLPSSWIPEDVMDGLVIGDGFQHIASGGKVTLCIGAKDTDYFSDELVGGLIGKKSSIAHYSYEVATTVTADELPRKWDIQVPDRFRFGTNYKVQGFLRGLYSANGSICGNRVTLKASSKVLIEQVQEMLSALGIRSYYTHNKPSEVEFANGTYVCKQSWDLNISTDRVLFQQQIGFIQKYKQEILDGICKGYTSSRPKNEYDIVDVEYLGEFPVYDITVADSEHVYWTGGVLVSNCGEQPLPPFGACLLGSFNLAKYLVKGPFLKFNWEQFQLDIPHVVRAMDNVVDRATYPLPQQEAEAKSKRRMGLGITGLANAAEALGCVYGSREFISFEEDVLGILRNAAYEASADLAIEKGAFQLFRPRKYAQGQFFKTLPENIQEKIKKHGIRNSHLLSIAPTGTISLCADNVSSGIEPVFDYSFDRTVIEFEGPRKETVEDYGVRVLGVRGKRASEVTVQEHVDVLVTAQKFVDSAVSKTCNVPKDIAWKDFKNIYFDAWQRGAKGCSTFRVGGKRSGVLESAPPEGLSCAIDASGRKSCE